MNTLGHFPLRNTQIVLEEAVDLSSDRLLINEILFITFVQSPRIHSITFT